MSQFLITPARSNDTEEIRRLLVSAGLPSEDFVEHLCHYWAARQDKGLVGAVGLEIYGQAGLLRSLAVDDSFRGEGLGTKLCEQIFEYAAAQGVSRLFLLTTTAVDFFPRLGFSIVDRDSAPPVIRDTKEFSSICPSTAVCMSRTL